MAVPYTFQTATGSIPLSQLDSNFSTAITIGNTAVILGESITTINNLSLANVTISSVASAFPNNYLANSNVIVGTTTLTLGSTVTSINGLSLSNVTISSGNVTISNVTTTNVTATTANVTTANVGTLVVIGNETVGGNTTVTGNITAAKGTFTSANVTGTANVQVIAVTQNATVAGNATVTGNVSAANGTFTSANVSGTANVSTLAVVINATIGGNATVTGNVGIGISPPVAALDVTGAPAGALSRFANTTAPTLDNSTHAGEAIFLRSGGTAGSGNVQAVLAFGKADGSSIRTGSAIASVQNTADADQVGIGFYTSPSTGSTQTLTQQMLLDYAGNLGLGVTPSAWLAGSQAIQNGGGSFWQNSNTSIYFGQNYYTNSSSQRIYSTTAGASEYQQTTGSHLWFSAPSGTAGNSFTFTKTMTLNASGNLGLGTATISAGYTSGNGSLTLQNAKSLAFNNASDAWSATTTGGAITYFSDNNLYIDAKDSTSNIVFRVNGATERMRIDSVGNAQFQAGAVMPYAPAPTGIAAATTLTNANIQGQIISATGTTYTITMPLGSTLDTLASWVTTNIGYDFFVINTATGVITMAVNTGVTSLGSLTVAIGVSAHFRIRRTAASTYVLYRLV